MAKIKTLKQGGEILYPRTSTKAVLDDSGNTVESLLSVTKSTAEANKTAISGSGTYDATKGTVQSRLTALESSSGGGSGGLSLQISSDVSTPIKRLAFLPAAQDSAPHYDGTRDNCRIGVEIDKSLLSFTEAYWVYILPKGGWGITKGGVEHFLVGDYIEDDYPNDTLYLTFYPGFKTDATFELDEITDIVTGLVAFVVDAE